MFSSTILQVSFYSFLIINGNAINICEKCSCQNKDAILTMDCTARNLAKIEWPSNAITIKATFSGNSFPNLEKLPATNSTLFLDFSSCKIRSLSEKSFGATENLKSLDLSRNRLLSEEIVAVKLQGDIKEAQPKNLLLEDLNLAYNKIHSLNKNAFKFLPNLKRLNLEGNDFKVIDIQTQLAFTKISGLRSLNLANNELTEIIHTILEPLQELTEINLSRNELDLVPHSLKFIGQSLEILILDENPILEMSNNTFSDLPNLIEISANNLTQLLKIEANSFAQNTKLSRLSLCNNTHLEEISASAFPPNSTLNELYLNNDNLRNLPFDLIDWYQLDAFEAANNPLVCTCDLFKISTALSRFWIASAGSTPTCQYFEQETRQQSLEIDSLQSDICEAKKRKLAYNHFSLPMVGLVVVLMVGLLVAVALSKQRYKMFVQRKRNHSDYLSQVMYSPVLNART